MKLHRKIRLAQSHKLANLSEHLSRGTNFTSEEVRLLLLIHQKIEESGAIDRTRFRELMCVVFGITDDLMLDLLFRAFDRDSDGFIDDIEWIRGMSIILRGSLDQLIDLTYAVYDMNGDGSLAREELYQCLKGSIHAGYGLEEDEMEECERDIIEIAMRKLDWDKDGQITLEDFYRAVRNDALLLQACGSCLPSTHRASTFQCLISERYNIYSALYPKLPKRKSGHGHGRKSAKASKTAHRVGFGKLLDTGPGNSLLSTRSSDSSIMSGRSMSSLKSVHARLDFPGMSQARSMSLSVVKTMKNVELMMAVAQSERLRVMGIGHKQASAVADSVGRKSKQKKKGSITTTSRGPSVSGGGPMFKGQRQGEGIKA